jgi:sugar/nucleoside kinase (ribokinase family)
MQSGIEAALRFAVACGAQAVRHIGGATNAPDAGTIHVLIDSNTGGMCQKW